MEPFYLLVVLAVIVITNGILTVVGWLSVLWKHAPPAHWRFERRRPFLSPVAHRCHHALITAVGCEYHVLTNVALTALVVGVTTRHCRTAPTALRCSGLWVDFVICAAADHHPLCVILLIPELKPARVVRWRLDMIQYSCEVAGLPVVAVCEQADYAPDMLREQIGAVLNTEAHRGTATDPLYADEEALLAALAVAMRDT